MPNQDGPSTSGRPRLFPNLTLPTNIDQFTDDSSNDDVQFKRNRPNRGRPRLDPNTDRICSSSDNDCENSENMHT